MAAWIVALISWRLLGTREMCMPRALNMTPRKMASDLEYRGIIWHTFDVPNYAIPESTNMPHYARCGWASPATNEHRGKAPKDSMLCTHRMQFDLRLPIHRNVPQRRGKRIENSMHPSTR